MNFSRRVWGLYQSSSCSGKLVLGRDARDPNNSSNPTSWMRKTWSKLKTPHPQSGTKSGLPLEDSACPFSLLRSGYEAYIYQTFKSDDPTTSLESKDLVEYRVCKQTPLPSLTHACLPSLFWLRVGSGFKSEPINSLGVT